MTRAERRHLIETPFPQIRTIAPIGRYATGYQGRPLRSMSRDLKHHILPRPWSYSGDMTPTLPEDITDDVMVREMIRSACAAI